MALLRRLMEGGVPKLVLDVNTDGAAVGQIGIVTGVAEKSVKKKPELNHSL